LLNGREESTVEKNDGTYSTTSDVLVIVGSDLA
jgi:hypothetical protein